MSYEVIVVGGGHAGTEAALVAARMGCRTALVTFHAHSIGQMSCNPAIGGLGKGQLVKEVDALFGEMGRAIDDTGIQFRTLNTSKGPAVRSSRAQADRDLYQARVRQAVNDCPMLDVVEAEVARLAYEGEKICGIYTAEGILLSARSVVLTTGTFLAGLMHTGEKKTKGGRVGDAASYTLSDSIRGLGFKMGRMKTGTPPRLKRSSINFSILQEQPGDYPIQPFSFRTTEIKRKQISCWITNTNERTHQIIRDNAARSPMFNGQIESRGPRYCPSIEDKVFRFADKSTHNIFLEPEGFDSDIVYPNGISTSLPIDVQDAFVRSISGLENVEFLCSGYAVEYDYVEPTELEQTLMTRACKGLFFAGQINGTTGYEEAAAQGMLAGINAAQYAQDKEPVVFGRDQGYIGVLIDDLTTLGVIEPYRMFTSRAEYRLHLREDNADSRLTPVARDLGLVNDKEWQVFASRQERMEKERGRLEKTFIKPTEENNLWLKSLGSSEIKDGVALSQLLRRSELRYTQLMEKFPIEPALSAAEATRVEVEVKFEGYLKRQEQDIARLKKMETVKIPDNFRYVGIKGLSVEVTERLNQIQPKTLGQAARVSGVTPAAVSLLAIHLRRQKGSSDTLIVS